MRRTYVVSLLLAATALVGCKARTEIVLGVLTDLRAPDVLDQVELVVRDTSKPATDDPLIQYQWDISGVPDQPFVLPGSFGLYSSDGSEPRMKITLTGSKNGQVHVTRQSVVTLISQQTLFLRQTLVAGCADKSDCKDELGQTCVEGRCVDQRVDARILHAFQAPMITSVQCNSGTQYIDTSTGEALVPENADCDSPTDWCEEGTCYMPPPLPPDTEVSWFPSGGAPTANGLDAVLVLPHYTGFSNTPDGYAYYAAGKQGTVLRKGVPLSLGTTSTRLAVGAWQVEKTDTTKTLRALAGESDGSLRAVGDGGTILMRDEEGNWSADTSAWNITADLRGAWAYSGDIYVVGEEGGRGVLLRGGFGGRSWDPIELPTENGPVGGLLAVHGRDYSDVWMVGRGGVVLYFNSDSFERLIGTPDEDFTSVWVGESYVYITSSAGHLYAIDKSDHSQFIQLDTGDNANPLLSVWGFADQSVVAVGNGGTIFRGDVTELHREYMSKPVWLEGVSGNSLQDALAVGAGGAIFTTQPGQPSVDTDMGTPPPDMGTSLPDMSTSLPDMSMPSPDMSTSPDMSLLDGGTSDLDMGDMGAPLSCNETYVTGYQFYARADSGAPPSWVVAATYHEGQIWALDNSAPKQHLFAISPDGAVTQVLLDGALDQCEHLVANEEGFIASASGTNQLFQLRYVSGATFAEVTSFAGTGQAGFGNGSVESASFNMPGSLAVDADGSVYVADVGNHAIRKIANGVVSTLVGKGTAGTTDGTADVATLNSISSMVYEPTTKSLYFVDYSSLVGNYLRRTRAVDGYTESLGTFGTYALGTLAADGRGYLFNRGANPGRLQRYTVATGTVESMVQGAVSGDGLGCEVALPSSDTPNGPILVADPAGYNVWDLGDALRTIEYYFSTSAGF